jgi:hypothetical protein
MCAKTCRQTRHSRGTWDRDNVGDGIRVHNQLAAVGPCHQERVYVIPASGRWREKSIMYAPLSAVSPPADPLDTVECMMRLIEKKPSALLEENITCVPPRESLLHPDHIHIYLQL